MDYFTELLDSYSRLKKRKFKILEQGGPNQIDDNRVAQASNIFANALQKGTPNRTGTTVEGVVGSNKYKYFKGTKTVTIGMAMGSWDETTKTLSPQNNNTKSFKQLLTLILGGASGTGTDAGTVAPPKKGMTFGAGEDAKTLQNSIDEYGVLAERVREAIKETKEYQEWESKGRKKFWEYVTGNYSIPALMSKMTLVKVLDGQYEIDSETTAPPEDIQQVTRNIDELYRLLQENPNNLSINEVKKLLSCFAVFENGSVALKLNGRMYIGSDGNGSLKMMLRILESRLKVKDEQFSLEVMGSLSNSTGALSNIIGKFNEYSHNITSLVNMVLQNPELKNNPAFMRVYSKAMQDFKKYYEGLKALKVELTANEEGYVVNEQTQEFIDAIQEALDDFQDGVNTFEQQLALSIKRLGSVAIERGSDFSIPYGSIVGKGERTDNLEVYENAEKIETSLRNQGVPEDLIKGAYKEVTLAELIAAEGEQGITREVADAVVEALKFKFGDKFDLNTKFCVTSESLKAYKDTSKIKGGQSAAGQRAAALNEVLTLIRQGQGEKIDKFMVDGFAHIDSALGSNTSRDDVLEMHQEFEKDYSTITSLDSPEALTTTKSGSRAKIKVSKNIAKIYHDHIKKQKGYEDSVSEAELKKLIDDINESDNPPETQQDLHKALMSKVALHIKHKKLKEYSESGDANKQRRSAAYMAMEAWQTAGCRQNTFLNVIGTQTNVRMRAFQNDIMIGAVGALAKGKRNPPDLPKAVGRGERRKKKERDAIVAQREAMLKEIWDEAGQSANGIAYRANVEEDGSQTIYAYSLAEKEKQGESYKPAVMKVQSKQKKRSTGVYSSDSTVYFSDNMIKLHEIKPKKLTKESFNSTKLIERFFELQNVFLTKLISLNKK